ncbi:MAG: ROK family protein [Chloroflexota bacterium]
MKPSHAIGLDVGGTKIAGGIVSQQTGQVLERRIIPTLAKRGGEAVFQDCVSLAQVLFAEANSQKLDIQGIGLGVPELVDLEGNLTEAYNFDWRGIDVPQAFAHLAPAIVDSDVRSSALAEAVFGAGKSYRLFAYVTIGTGISYCLVQDGRPYAGARGNALLLASAPITTTCPACAVTSQVVLEEFAAGPALVARYNQTSDQAVATGEAVFEALNAGDPIAQQVITSAGEALGGSIGFLVNILDPEAIVIGGGLGLAGGLYWETLIQSTRKHIYADSTRDLPIIPATLHVDAGLIGAATLIFQNLSDVS